MKIILLLAVLLITIQADKYEKGFQKVNVQVATVLDGYFKEFEGVLCNQGSQFYIWHEKSQSKSLKELLPTHPFIQIGLNGAVMGLPLQNFVPQVTLNEDTRKSVILTVKPEVQKGSTVKITFLNDDEEQDDLIEQLEGGFEEYVQLENERFDYAALKFEGRFIQYVKRVHDDL